MDRHESRYAAAVQCERVITVPFPIFHAFGMHGNLPYRMLVKNCINLLMPDPLIKTDGPSTMEVTVMRQTRRTVVHLLQFVAERRTNIDIIEDIVPLYDVPISVRLDHKPKRDYLAPSREEIPITYRKGRAETAVPQINGHQMLVIE